MLFSQKIKNIFTILVGHSRKNFQQVHLDCGKVFEKDDFFSSSMKFKMAGKLLDL